MESFPPNLVSILIRNVGLIMQQTKGRGYFLLTVILQKDLKLKEWITGERFRTTARFRQNEYFGDCQGFQLR